MTANAHTHEARLALTSTLNVLFDERGWSDQLFRLVQDRLSPKFSPTQAKNLENICLSARSYSDVTVYIRGQMSKNNNAWPLDGWPDDLLALFSTAAAEAMASADALLQKESEDRGRMRQQAVLQMYRKLAAHFAAFVAYRRYKEKVKEPS